MIRILRDAYLGNLPITADFLKNKFLEIRDLCAALAKNGKNTENMRFSVKGNAGNELFKLEFLQNWHPFSSNEDGHYSFWDYDYNKLDDLDYQFLSGFDNFLFYEIEEYSFFIIEVLRRKFPGKKIASLDILTPLIWEGEEVKLWRSAEPFNESKTLIVYPSFYKHFNMRYLPSNNIMISSTYLMHSLVWASKAECLGELNKDKTIFLIDYASEAGLMDFVRCTAALILYGKNRGWIPMAHLNLRPNRYMNPEDTNMWESFFEPSCGISYEDALKSHRVVRTQINNFQGNDFWANPVLVSIETQFRELCYKDTSAAKSVLHLNYETMNFIHKLMPNELNGSKILGVVCRGSDYAKMGRATNAEIMLTASKDYFEKHNCEYIFIATEEEEVLEKFQDYWKNKLLFIPQKRVSNYKEGFVSEQLEIEDKKEFARTYLAVIYSLSRCSVLISSMECGAYIGAMMFADLCFEETAIISQDYIPGQNG